MTRVRVAVVSLVLLLAGCAAAPASDDAPADGGFYVDQTSAAALQEATWRQGGRAADADQIAKISRRPQAKWLTTDVTRVEAQARDQVTRAGNAKRTAVLVAYDIPARDCAGFSAGGAPDATAYRAWVAAVGRGISGTRPTLILEPDAVAGALDGCLAPQQRAERLGLLAEAGATLTRAGAKVYLDAGNPGWISDTAGLADALRTAGVGRLAGFALNVSNFYATADVVSYGRAVASRLNGAHFVVDTSRNGNGPAGGTDGPAWCNPPGRALGHAPTTGTGDPQVDAFLWIKSPGTSDGTCRPGAPDAGQWWPEYALALAEASP
ncbi:MAG TPA: glycoside hydrolase family 6 protein [Amycolatopsis sp.]|nr:glycoside hydrolase family 6 protein [Amycolatopsis sp.]